MQFRILGSIEVEDNGLRIDLGGLRERALRACLLLSANRVVSAGRPAEDLWSGSPPPHSGATLRVYIARLRRVLGPQAGLLVTQAPGYRLNVADDQVDALRFEGLMRAAEADMAAGRPAAATALRESLELWHGPALSDVADLPFAQGDADRLEEARLTALDRTTPNAVGRRPPQGGRCCALRERPVRRAGRTLAGRGVIAIPGAAAGRPADAGPPRRAWGTTGTDGKRRCAETRTAAARSGGWTGPERPGR